MRKKWNNADYYTKAGSICLLAASCSGVLTCGAPILWAARPELWRWATAWLAITVTAALIFCIMVGLILFADAVRKEESDAGTEDPPDN